ncbi:hypothetical protein BDR07DRAFT_1440321, partial [Suillus spraguei]
SGLTQACVTSPHTRKMGAPKRTAVLAGNSVHADRSFLVEEMPELVYVLQELCRRWYPDNQVPKDASAGRHRAYDDIMDSIQELSWYRQNIFVRPVSRTH